MRLFLVAMACFTLAVSNVVASTDKATGQGQDISNIKQFERLSNYVDGVRAYQDYLARRPMTPAKFSQKPTRYARTTLGSQRGISILVDANLAPQIQTELNNYIDDLRIDGYDVFLDTVTGGTPQEIKAWVASRYAQGSEGVIFIGDITFAWAEVAEPEKTDVFPCDLYYMDLDGVWIDADHDGDFELHLGDQGPEVYVARMYTKSLTWDSESNMLNDYFRKTRNYRDGILKQPWRGLEYIDNDWRDMIVSLNEIYDSSVDRCDLGSVTTAENYLSTLTNGYQFVQVCAHGGGRDQFFSKDITDAAVYLHTYVFSPSARYVYFDIKVDDCVKVWLNGEVVGGGNGDNTIILDLNEGWNTLLCKVVQYGGDFTFSTDFRDLIGGSSRSVMDEGESSISDLVFNLSDPMTPSTEPGYLNAYMKIGPYSANDIDFSQLLTTNFLGVDEATVRPVVGETMGGESWKMMYRPSDFVHLGNSKELAVGYAYANLWSDYQKDCLVTLSYDDGISVWLNGENIHYDDRQGDGNKQTVSIPVVLNRGDNHILIKVSYSSGMFGANMQYANSDGGAGGIKVRMPRFFASQCQVEWLIDGPYLNYDKVDMVNEDLLGGEATIRPNEGDATSLESWQQFWMHDGCFIDFADMFKGSGRDGIKPIDIYTLDPPVLFYNVFTCSGAYFFDENYFAGTYIYGTSSGLISVASTKPGSMLCFDYFTKPLSQAKNFGQAFMDWFDSRAPFDNVEQGWFYGVVLNGDPTLMVYTRGDANCDGVVDKFDIEPFVLGLVDPSAYKTQYPNCENLMADVNRDGVVDVFDIDPFIDRLVENMAD